MLAIYLVPVRAAFCQQLTEFPKREFRGIWVATVVNIDWPSAPGLNPETQKQELIRLLDNHQRAGINAILLQIRPSADALYAKSREPWSRFLTGKQGQAPQPFYDPLSYAIDEAHKRGMELHAWLNPYRATFDLNPANISSDHVTRTHPEWFFIYGGRKLFNPGLPAVREYIVNVVMDVVRNYDIDGIHFDDYFYPYPERGKPLSDEVTYQLYGKNFHNIDDWRRNNVDQLIETLADSIHAVKKYIKFGVSPFGIWDNKKQHPDGSESSGFSGYRQLYADARKWMQQGWVDYINPQIYFPFSNRSAAFDKLTDWWSANTYGHHLYIGQALYRAEERSDGWNDRRQIPNQLRYLRQNNRIQGSVFFSSKSLMNNFAGLRDSLQYGFYKYKALPPAMNWLDSIAPTPPSNLRASITGKHAITLTWTIPGPAADGDMAYGFVVYRFMDGEPLNLQKAENILNIGYDGQYTQFTDNSLMANHSYIYVVTAIDRIKNESEPSSPLQIILR